MALATRFSDLLDDCLERRTEGLRRVVIPGGQGAPKKFNKRIRDRLRSDLLNVASTMLVRKYARKELNELAARRRLKHGDGYGVDGRFRCVYQWATNKLRGPIVYAFWHDKKCLYVGKGKSYRRLRSYRRHTYLKAANSLEIWQIRSKAQLPSAECLAIHLFTPRDNQNKAAKVKWGRKCPVCRRHDKIRRDIGALLRLK